MSTTGTRRRVAAELEERIAHLDERLRIAKSSAYGGGTGGTRDPITSPVTIMSESHAGSQVSDGPQNRNLMPEIIDRFGAIPNITSVHKPHVAGTTTASSLDSIGRVERGNLTISGQTPIRSNTIASGFEGRIASPLFVDPNCLGKGVQFLEQSNGLPRAPQNQSATTDIMPTIPATVGASHGDRGLDVRLPNQSLPQTQQLSSYRGSFETYSSPWRESAFRSQLEASAQLQSVVTDVRSRRLDALVKDVEITNKEVEERDEQLLWYTARKNTASAEMHTYLREVNEKVAKLEALEMKTITETSSMRAEVEKVQHQLKEVRDAMGRATDRAHAIHTQRVQLEATMRGAEEASANKDVLEAEWNAHHSEVVMFQLESRVAAARADLKVAKDRLETREQTLSVSRSSNIQEANSMQNEIETSKEILADLLNRGNTLTAELQALKKQSLVAAQQRQHKSHEAEQRRKNTLEKEVTRIKEENATAIRKIAEQSSLITTQLQEEVSDLKANLSKTSSLREETGAVNVSLSEKLTSLRMLIQSKHEAESECAQMEKSVTALLASRERNKLHIGELQSNILQGQDTIRQLEFDNARLDELLHEESRLKTLLGSLSHEMASSTALRNEDTSHQEETQRVMAVAHKEALEKVAVAENELQRIRNTNAAVLDSLTRKLHNAKEGLSLKERQLDELLSKNTQLQNTIIQFEEEKRRMEREAMSRKEAASRAAKAALLDLA